MTGIGENTLAQPVKPPLRERCACLAKLVKNRLTLTSGRYGEYYRACRARGMGHGRALKAVARKRLRAIYAVMRDRVPYRE